MHKKYKPIILFPIIIIGSGILFRSYFNSSEITPSPISKLHLEIQTKKTIKIGLQAGHWKDNELPDELKKLRLWGGGSISNGYEESEITLAIANKTAEILKKSGFEVDVLPATVPEGYEADAFVSIHADGNNDKTVTGFKVASNKFDTTGVAKKISDAINIAYKDATKMRNDPTITADMTEYYAFNSVKFNHSISTKTPGVIIEIGFLTNANDRAIIAKNPDLVAKAIAEGIVNGLK